MSAHFFDEGLELYIAFAAVAELLAWRWIGFEFPVFFETPVGSAAGVAQEELRRDGGVIVERLADADLGLTEYSVGGELFGETGGGLKGLWGAVEGFESRGLARARDDKDGRGHLRGGHGIFDGSGGKITIRIERSGVSLGKIQTLGLAPGVLKL